MTNLKLKILIVITIIFLVRCKEGKNSSDYYKPFVDTTKVFKKEIPTYPDGQVSIFYKVSKDIQKQLNLDNLEKGFENLQIRLWYDFALVSERALIIITNKDSTWKSLVYNYKVDWD